MKRGLAPSRQQVLALKGVAYRREGVVHLRLDGSIHRTPVLLIPLLLEAPRVKHRQLRCFSVVSPQILRWLALGSAGLIPRPLRVVLRLAPL